MHTKKDLRLTAIFLSLFLPFTAWTTAEAPTEGATIARFEAGQPFEQDLVITAYYSPLPDQCCYVKGNLAADIELNGRGTNGADGTAVYPGMVAAPPSYPFGTRIVLPGIGTVTVHDRGGAIQEQGKAHRLDIWAGHGEEGLARALAFGVKRVRAVIYPPSSAQPAESIDLAALPAPPERLSPYLTDGTTMFQIHAKLGDSTASVQFMQERLKEMGYFTHHATGMFGPVTQQSLAAFYADVGVDEPADRLTEAGAAYLEAAYQRRKVPDPIPAIVTTESSVERIQTAQRTLRFLGYYKGRTHGQYDDTFRAAVLKFQLQQGIVASDGVSGAGRIGPQTKRTIALVWRAKHAGMLAERLLAMRKIDQLLVKKGYDIGRFIGKGDTGVSVRALQKFLVTKNYLAPEDVTGTFGIKTEQAVIDYQRAAGIIADASDHGAGYAGPATLARFRQDLRKSLLQVVRAQGWQAI